ncbi:MAG: peptide-methionine (S)-S-oxide reductase MsrA [Sphaerochaetaceae bacterium]|nr:peptide-methionine (S)-S-oxide reductase MsrA [Sphaerochaetaceae bacterium]MDC7236215.1 peptide-methionine (S)-S-oxide reductase MsrA [Sphaerochaetaceae bacterium]
MNKIYLAGGCFWGTQHFFSLVNGVTSTKVGYANGTIENPSYEQVCSKIYNFAETVEIEYDENQIELDSLLNKFFITIDPTSLNKQGGDRGLQYRTGIYYLNEEDRKIAKKALDNLQSKYSKPIQIELLPLKNFYNAEDYHQDYLKKNPTGYCHIPLDIFKRANE